MAHFILHLTRGGRTGAVLLPPPGETVLKGDPEPLLLRGPSEESHVGRISRVHLSPEAANDYCDFSGLIGAEIRPNEDFQTDDIRLTNPAEDPLLEPLRCLLELDVIFDAPGTPALPKSCPVEFTLEPFPKCDKIFSIDFGNSSTTCVILPISVGKLFEDRNFRCLDLDQVGGDREGTQVTAIRFLDYDATRLTRSEVGNKVVQGFIELMAEGSVESVKRAPAYHTGGIKRRLGKGTEEDTIQVISADKSRDASANSPSLTGHELVGHTLKGFVRKAEQSRLPHDDKPLGQFVDLVVATHPVNYTPSHLEAMRNLYKDFLGLDPSKVELRYDEATAAAIYYLTRQLRGERIHHFWAATDDPLLPPPKPGEPEVHKFNMLVFDCGGGTTDIALLGVEIERRTASNAKGEKTANWFEIRPTVLGLTGLENFAGDNMTLEAMLLLRFRLAQALVETGQEIEVLSQAFLDSQKGRAETADLTDQRGFWSFGDAQNFKTYLKELGQLIASRTEDESDLNFYAKVGDRCRYIVPTDFGQAAKDTDPSSTEYRLRRNLFNHLWNAAEKLKIGLSKPENATFRADVPAELLRQFRTPDGKELLALCPDLSTIEVKRSELNSLISSKLRKAWDLAADLCLELKKRGEKLHEVVLAGNGSQYPLVRELLQDQFAPAVSEWFSYQERRVRFDVSDAKFACAKGAAIAVWYTKQRAVAINEPDQTMVDFKPVSTPFLPWSLFVQNPNDESKPLSLFKRGDLIPDEPGFCEERRQFQEQLSIKRGLMATGLDLENYCEFAPEQEPEYATLPKDAAGRVIAEREIIFRVDQSFDLTAILHWTHQGKSGEIMLRRKSAPSSDPNRQKQNPFEGFN